MPHILKQPVLRHKMVGWYDPGQLLNTGIQVLISEVLGSRADYRLIESFSGPQQIFDFSQGEELWFDFVADLGDGWDSTYSVASMLAAEQLSVRDTAGASLQLPRARLLVMGGDEVYPVANRENYQERTVVPYASAFPESGDAPPALFAIPGNHDWYDGLISFNRLFCQPRWIGGWRTQQKRSYFAIRLPHNWWLWALDYQLESDIDEPQRDYFCRVAEQMPPGGCVILASAEPDWIYGNIYDARFKKNIAYLQKNVIEQLAKAELAVAIAGDLHHYRRHESGDGATQLITSGGGGAFILGTIGPKVDTVTVGEEPGRVFRLKAAYPDARTSSRLLLRNFLFPFINPKFGVVPGVLYLVIAWIYRVPLLHEYEEMLRHGDPAGGAAAVFRAILSSPFGFGVLLLVVAGFVAFTDTHERVYKYVAGTMHALANLAALFVVSAGASQLSREWLGFPDGSVRYLLSTAGLIFAGGYLAGAFIMGVYLYISMRLFRRHSQEAFSSLRLRDYKSFTRFRIAPDGGLTIYPIAVDRVPRKWRNTGSSNGPQFAPLDRLIEPRLIEPPIHLPASGSPGQPA